MVDRMSTIISVQGLNLWYSANQALYDVSMELPEHEITAFIGPSGCGKSTFLKTLNRMNDLIEGVRIEGKILYENQDIYAPQVDTTWLRKEIGMVFQKPNPFPMSIYDNIAYGPKLQGIRSKVKLDEIVEKFSERRRYLGRGQGSPEQERPGPFRWSAAETLHRACAGCRAEGSADG